MSFVPSWVLVAFTVLVIVVGPGGRLKKNSAPFASVSVAIGESTLPFA